MLFCLGAAALTYRALRGGEDVARTELARLEAPANAPSAPSAPAPGWSRDEHAEALARERGVLERSGTRAPALEVAPDAPLELRLIATRARVLRAPQGGAGRADDAVALPAESGALALALWTELQLDRLALGQGPADGLDDACARLERFAADPALAVRADGTATLVRSALGRAVGLGLAEGPPPAAAPALLEPEWFAALERAGREPGFGGRVPVGQLARPAR